MARTSQGPNAMALLTVDPDHAKSAWWTHARRHPDPSFRSLLRVLEQHGGVECPLADAERFVRAAAELPGWGA